ncbi:hypothetical protein JF535_13350 [Microbulbifer salipaludis]|uniref:Uncharacterized protein n=1 Tax=Microbulbifer salipaludis TaxID=187980 RepID=A0ABS3E951_9GAMM|nr:hypothetical protein [Microbulbifer salipaludis]MBN8431838.1 hypothetical protein [Microbulbifer salipaludis]
MGTNVEEFITDLDAGVFAEKLSRALSDVAAGVCDNEKKGKVTIDFDIQLLGSSQVNVQHTLKYTIPRRNGESTEKNVTKTAMHVGKGGRMTFFPENQHQMFTRTGEVEAKEKETN